jgi:acetyl esterase/lipase
MRLRFLAVVAALAVVASGCNWHMIVPQGDPPLRYRDAVFTTVDTTSNVTYRSAVNQQGQTVSLELDLYSPAGDTVSSRPAIVWIHGGSFCCGTKTSAEIVDEANTFAKRGYVNASIEYRLAPGGCSSGGVTTECVVAIQQALDDAQAAVAFLRANAGAYGIDPQRIAVAGTSAGAITALNVGFSNEESPTSKVRAAVSLSGARIFGAYNTGDAPSLLFHGSSDVVVPYQWAVNTIDGATAAGLTSLLVTWNGEGHVPYVQHRQQILDQTGNFLYHMMDLKHAAQ